MDFANHTDGRVRRAFEIARAAHLNQRDKAGVDYINHPTTVANSVGENISAIVVALLHDVVEDSDKNFDELSREVPLTVEELTALKLLTHDEKISYDDYVRQVASNELAARVKVADLRHNSDLSRIKNPAAKDFERVEKYRRALKILEATT